MKSIAFKGDYPITSPYGWRSDPFTGVRSFHNGIDVRTPMRTPLYAREAGAVRISTKDSYGGLYIQIKMADGRGYYQLHLDESVVKVGQQVAKGQLIGYSGNSGNSTGPHTHFGLQSNATVWGSCIDPTAFFTMQITQTPKFAKGDILVFTDIQNIRKGSTTTDTTNDNNKVIRQSTMGETFVVADTPRFADGYTWYDTGNGWVADVNKFTEYVPPIVIPTPTPEPEPTPEPTTPITNEDNPPVVINTPPEVSDTPEPTTEAPVHKKTFLEVFIQFFTDLLQRIKSE